MNSNFLVFFRKPLLLLCCLLLLCLPVSEALAADLSWSNCQTEALSFTSVLTLKTNQYAADRPVIVFLPGISEYANIGEVGKWIRSYALYDHLEVDVVAAAFWYEVGRITDWERMAADILDFLKDKHEAAPFPVIIDSVSYSGYGACFLAQLLTENGIPVKELNLADACLPGYVTAEWIAKLASMGIQVNIWASDEEGAMHEEARSIISELEGTENIKGYIMDVWHGEILHAAIYDYGAHSEYLESPTEETAEE